MSIPVPEPTVGDTKDWTWTAIHRCPECGFDPGAIADRDLGAELRASSARWRVVLERGDVRERPEPAVWSPLEYASHVRDVHRIFAQRVGRMLREDAPTFASWDQDEAAVTGRYWEQDPATVADELQSAGEDVAAVYDEVPGGAWSRAGRRGDGGAFTVSTIGHYHLHDVLHHLHDVQG